MESYPKAGLPVKPTPKDDQQSEYSAQAAKVTTVTEPQIHSTKLSYSPLAAIIGLSKDIPPFSLWSDIWHNDRRINIS